jgi:hypothetical protein
VHVPTIALPCPKISWTKDEGPCGWRIFAEHSSIMEKQEIIRLSEAIQEIIMKSGEQRLRPKELMPELIARGFFKKDEKFGKPLRDVLNRLDRSGELSLIPQVIADRQEKAVYWYFEAVDMPAPKPVKKTAVKKTKEKPKLEKPKVTKPKAEKAVKTSAATPAKKKTVVKSLSAITPASPKSEKKPVAKKKTDSPAKAPVLKKVASVKVESKKPAVRKLTASSAAKEKPTPKPASKKKPSAPKA